MEFIKDFFFLNFSQYENIGIYFPIGIFLILMCAITSASVFFITYYKKYTSSLYSQLLRHNALSEESAKTLTELRLDKSYAIRSALSRSNGQLTYIVKRAGEEKPSYEEYIKSLKKKGSSKSKIDFAEARFYIDPEKINQAKKLLEKGEPTWLGAGIISLISVGILLLCAEFLPDLLSFLNDVL